jgi:DNA-binding MarR family transcriptional regulator
MRLSRRLRGERPAGGVTISKLNMLGHLQSAGALSAGDLAARERAQPQTLTRLLAEMEREGLITREHDPTDRRRTIVRITPAGASTLVRDLRERDVWLAAAMEVTLTPVERELLRLAAALLDRLADT